MTNSARRSNRGRRWSVIAACALGTWSIGACSLDGLLKSNELPPNVTDPAFTRTPEGARDAYHGTLLRFQQVVFGGGTHGVSSLGTFIGATGLLSDELTGTLGAFGTEPNPVNLRRLDEGPNGGDLLTPVFSGLNSARQRARQARGLLNDYVPEEPALQGHLYAIEGYTEIMLAELFCSGIPLSTVDYQGDYTVRPGSTTPQVFTHAKALFDSALVLAGDSTRFLNLSRVGQGRALLGIGDYVAAAAAVAQVPDTFRYTLRYVASDSSYGAGFTDANGMWNESGVPDREGTNGLDYLSSGDPRTMATQISSGYYHPDKYTTTGADTVVLASGIEARLIEAEAALQAGDVTTWLAKLNGLRETAITPALPDTTDPGSDTARVSLLFRERAFWLFLTGHRQGDMRRLVREYGRLQQNIYPVGVDVLGGVYGDNIDAPLPTSERTLNPLYTGCLSRD